MSLFQAVKNLLTGGSSVVDFEWQKFPAEEHCSGSITPMVSMAMSRYGAMSALVVPTGNYRLHFRDNEGEVCTVIDADARDRVLADLRRQELEHGRVYRMPRF